MPRIIAARRDRRWRPATHRHATPRHATPRRVLRRRGRELPTRRGACLDGGMAVAIADGMHIVGTLARAGILRPSRPDRALRAIVGLRRFGPTLAAGYVGAAARYPNAPALIDELGT